MTIESVPVQFAVERRVVGGLREIEHRVGRGRTNEANRASEGTPHVDYVLRSLRVAPSAPIRGPFRHLATRTSLPGLFGGSIAVIVEIWPWSRNTSTVAVCPAGRRPDRWSLGRRRRYFRGAHDLAAQVAAALHTTVAAPAALHQERRSA